MFNLLFVNIQSVRKIKNELEALVADKSYGALCIAEHWLTSEECEEFFLDNYRTATFYSRKNMIHGGVMILVSKSYNFIPLTKINNFSIEFHCEVTAILLTELATIIITVYRSPSADFKIFINNLQIILNSLDLSKNVVIAGDFNVKFNEVGNQTSELLDMLESYNFYSNVNFNTRGNNRIDNVFVNNELVFHNKVTTHKVLNSLSDHRGAIHFSANLTRQQEITPKICRPITQSGRVHMYNLLDETNWDFLNDHQDGNLVFSSFFDKFLEYFHRCFPTKQTNIQRSRHNNPWFDDNIRTMRTTLSHLQEMYENNPNDENRRKRINYRYRYKKAIKEAKIKYNSQFILNSKNRSKASWQVLNKNRNTSAQTLSESISPNEFNAHFTNIANHLISSLPKSNISPIQYMSHISTPSNLSFSFQTVTHNIVRDTINSLKNSSGRDIYDINVSLIKELKDVIISPLTKVINCCINSSTFPDALKLAKVVPIHKNGDIDNVNNYRPISLLPIFSKIVEKILCQQMISYLETNNLFNNSQFGYRSRKSTTAAILEFLRIVTEGIENNEYCYASFIDLSKAFDCICHAILIDKLRFYKFCDKSCSLIRSYLSNRLQIVSVRNNKSNPESLTYGVPQGSILGPLLFLIYINDFPSSISETSILFADDTNIISKSSNLDQLLDKMRTILNDAQLWFESNKLCMNDEKTQNLLITLKKHNYDNSNSVKFLGVHIDPTLTWNSHVAYLCSKLCRIIYLFRNLTNSVSVDVLRIAYFSLFQSNIAYALLAWGHCSSASRIFALQRRIIRVIAGIAYREECKQHFVRLRIMTLPALYIYHCLLYAHQNAENFVTTDQIHSYNTRSTGKIYPQFSRLRTTRYSVNYFAVKFMNVLPAQLKQLNLAAFKNKVKQILTDNPIYSFSEFDNICFDEYTA